MRVYSFGARDGFPDQLEGPAFLYEDKSKEELWLIDVPSHINLMLRETDLSPMDLTAILVTHLHNDHVGGLIDLIQLRMICLANQDVMRQAGYFDKVATNVLPIYLFGYDEEWWQAIEQVIDKNCPDNWGDWRDYHKIVPVHKNLKKGSVVINRIRVEYRKTKHMVPCAGLKIADTVAISGDTPYDYQHVDWLTKEVSLVFHEAGYAGEHTKQEFLEKIVVAHKRLYFYHLPFPVVNLVKAMNLQVAQKKWLEVISFKQQEIFNDWDDEWHPGVLNW